MEKAIEITCDKLILSTFIDCWIDKTYTLLDPSGTLSEELAASLWDGIFKEYLRMTENLPMLKALTIIDQIQYWKNELLIIQACLQVLPAWRDDSIVKLLQDKGYRFAFNKNDEKSYLNDIKRVASRAKKIIADILELEEELKQLQGANKGEEYTRQDFTNDIVILSKFMGYHINKNECTVSEYVSMKNALYQYNQINTK